MDNELIKYIYYHKHNNNAYKVKFIYNKSNKCSIFTITKNELKYLKSKYKDIIIKGW
jgi:hypothetical protein